MFRILGARSTKRKSHIHALAYLVKDACVQSDPWHHCSYCPLEDSISDAQVYKLNSTFDLCLSLRSTSTYSLFAQQQMPAWSFTILMWAMRHGYNRRQLYVTNKTATSTQTNELHKNVLMFYRSVNLYHSNASMVKILFAIQTIWKDSQLNISTITQNFRVLITKK